ncbi:MAG: extracellular solute-binding protein [Candidatus Vecturithrix sp.]|jgi:arabinosaccharide transport system substrate-binding protein|nr:extracellular solute-binding protein [Candidatus Vecturithrix sp.]
MKNVFTLLVAALCLLGIGYFGEPVSAAAPTELSFWTFQQFHVKLIEAGAEAWNEKHPDQPVVIKADVLPYEDMHTKLLVAFQSGVGAPDISDIEIGKFPNYLRGEIQLAPLNDIIEPVKDNFVQARLDIYAKDGSYYGAPYHVGATVMYYNTEILDQAGVNSDNIKTWADFAEAGKVVLEKTGKPMTTFELSEHWSQWQLVSQKGSDFLDKDGKVIVDDEINVSVLQFQADMVKAGTAVVPPGGYHHSEEYWGFMNQGGAASVVMPMWYMGRFVEYMPDLKGKIIIRPLPRWEEDGFRSAGMGGTGTVVTNQSKNIELAKGVLAEAKLTQEANIRIWNLLGFDPPRWDVWPMLKDQPDNQFTDYFGKGIFDILTEVKDEIRPVNIDAMTPATISAYQTTAGYAVFEEGRDPAEVLKEIAEELRAQQ